VYVRTKNGKMLHLRTCARAARAGEVASWYFAEGLTVDEIIEELAGKGVERCGFCRPLDPGTKRFARDAATCDHPESNRARRSWSLTKRGRGGRAGVTTIVSGVRKREWCLLCGHMFTDDVIGAIP
jgi:hypothetical protein